MSQKRARAGERAGAVSVRRFTKYVEDAVRVGDARRLGAPREAFRTREARRVASRCGIEARYNIGNKMSVYDCCYSDMCVAARQSLPQWYVMRTSNQVVCQIRCCGHQTASVGTK